MNLDASPNFGYVYALANPAIPNLVKIGKTKLHPEGRAQQLSGETSAPTPFVVLYFRNFNNMHEAEKWVHTHLSAAGKRPNPKREFFQIDPKAAIDSILSAPDEAAKEIESTDQMEDSVKFSNYLYEVGSAQLNGGDDEVFEDIEAGLLNLEKAAALNNFDATLELFNHYNSEALSSGKSKFYDQARSYIVRLEDLNPTLSTALYCRFFVSHGEWNNYTKAWMLFVERAKEVNSHDFEISSAIVKHVELRAYKNFFGLWRFDFTDEELKMLKYLVSIRIEEITRCALVLQHVSFTTEQKLKNTAIIKKITKIVLQK